MIAQDNLLHTVAPQCIRDTGLGPKLSLGGSQGRLIRLTPSDRKLGRPPTPRVCVFPYSVTDSRVVPPLFSESPCPSGAILRLRLNPSTGGALTTETQPEEPEMAACRSSGLTTSLSCQVRFRSSGSCSIGPLRRDRRLGSTLANQDAGWLSGGRGGASLPAVSPQLLRGEHGSVGVLWWPPPPLWRLGWAWLHAASAGLGEAEAVSAPGLLSVAVSKLFWRKKPSPQILKGA